MTTPLRRRRLVRTDADQEPPDAVRASDWAALLRVLDGLALLVALVVIAIKLHSRLSDAAPDVSAPQIIQAYVESAYQALIAIGVAIAFYVGSHGLST